MPESIVILSFADQKGRRDRLNSLQREANKLYQLFLPFANSDFVSIRFYPQITLGFIAADLKGIKKRVAVWHFGGHATGAGIELDDQKLALGPLSLLIGKRWKPRLVFLNGCETRELASPLLAAGIDAVIATNAKVEDGLASLFAIHFYESWLGGSTLVEAFDLAEGLVVASWSHDQNARGIEGRHIAGDIVGGENGKAFPWEMHLRNEQQGSLRFRNIDGNSGGSNTVPIYKWVFTLLVIGGLTIAQVSNRGGSSGLFWGSSHMPIDFEVSASPPEENLFGVQQKKITQPKPEERLTLVKKEKSLLLQFDVLTQMGLVPTFPPPVGLELFVQNENGVVLRRRVSEWSFEVPFEERPADSLNFILRDSLKTYSISGKRQFQEDLSRVRLPIKVLKVKLNYEDPLAAVPGEVLKLQFRLFGSPCDSVLATIRGSQTDLDILIGKSCWKNNAEQVTIRVLKEKELLGIGQCNMDSLLSVLDPVGTEISVQKTEVFQ